MESVDSLLSYQSVMYKLNARHPDVLLKTIKIYKYRQNTTKYIILYHFWTTCFDSPAPYTRIFQSVDIL